MSKGFLLFALIGMFQASPHAEILVIQGGSLFDGTGSDPTPNISVIIEGNRIREIGQGLSIPPGARVIDARDHMILPGLIDPHIHFRAWMPQFFLYFGVTSAFDTANPTEWILAQKEAIAKGKMNGPRLFVTGLVVDGPRKEGAPPHPTEVGGYRIHVDTAQEARQWVRLLHEKGVDGIKVHDGLSPELLKAVVQEAERLGLPVVGHSWNAHEAIESGLRFMEHITPIARATIPPERLEQVGASSEIAHLMEEGRFKAVIRQMVENKVVFNPTLLGEWANFTPLVEEYAHWDKEFADQPFAPEALRQRIARRGVRVHRPSQAEAQGYRKTRRFVKEYLAAGGIISPGSDTGAIPGLGLHREMQLLVEFGSTPKQALLGATRDAALLIGKERDLGTVEPGKLADLLIVDGNPLQNIADTQKIKTVILDGKIIDRKIDPDFKNQIPRTAVNEIAVPEIEALEPYVVQMTSLDVTVAIQGANFTPTSKLFFSDRTLPTSFISSTEIRARIPGSMLGLPGTFPLTVITPGSGGSIGEFKYLIVKY